MKEAMAADDPAKYTFATAINRLATAVAEKPNKGGTSRHLSALGSSTDPDPHKYYERHEWFALEKTDRDWIINECKRLGIHQDKKHKGKGGKGGGGGQDDGDRSPKSYKKQIAKLKRKVAALEKGNSSAPTQDDDKNSKGNRHGQNGRSFGGSSEVEEHHNKRGRFG